MTKVPHPRHRSVTKTARDVAVGAVGVALLLASCAESDGDSGAASTDASTAVGTAPAEPEVTEEAPESIEAEPDDTEAAPETLEADSESTEAAPETAAMDDTAVDGEEPPVCQPYFEASAAFNGEPDPATIGGVLDAIDAAAPADVAADTGLITGSARTVLETGDFSVFEDPEFGDAVSAADTWMFDNCEFATTGEIIATDYAYAGDETAYPAGRTGLRVINEGMEPHELVIVRKNDGVDADLEELLALPEEEAETMTTYVGGTFVGEPGASSVLVTNLGSGNYIAVCNIPAGTTVAEDGSFTEGTGQSHAELGMNFEFTVE